MKKNQESHRPVDTIKHTDNMHSKSPKTNTDIDKKLLVNKSRKQYLKKMTQNFQNLLKNVN